MRYLLVQNKGVYTIIAVTNEYMDQFIGLIRRLRKELPKIKSNFLPQLPVILAEFRYLELHEEVPLIDGNNFLDELERDFMNITETTYPVRSLLTEIRAVKAQLEDDF